MTTKYVSLIRGMSFSGAAMIITIPFLFQQDTFKLALVALLGVSVMFGVFSVKALRMKKRMGEE